MVFYTIQLHLGISSKLKPNNISLPDDAIMKAQLGLKLIKEAIVAFINENPQGITNSNCAHYLGLQSNKYGGTAFPT